jgi:hypothetical protein
MAVNFVNFWKSGNEMMGRVLCQGRRHCRSGPRALLCRHGRSHKAISNASDARPNSANFAPITAW